MDNLKEFLNRLFGHKKLHLDLETFYFTDIVYLPVARLYAYYLSFKFNESLFLLPKEFSHPLFNVFTVQVGEKLSIKKLIKTLEEFGYSQQDRIYDLAQYSRKGDTIVIYTNLCEIAYRVSFLGDIVENISLINPSNFRFIKELNNLLVVNCHPKDLTFVPELLGDYEKIHSRPLILVDNYPAHLDVESLDKLTFKKLPFIFKSASFIDFWESQYKDYVVYYSGEFYEKFISDFVGQSKSLNPIKIENVSVEYGFSEDLTKTILLTDYEAYCTLYLDRFKKALPSKFTKFFDNKVKVGDYVVHEAHGIGIYKGVEEKEVLNTRKEFVILEYKDGDLLFVPLNQLFRVSKYVSTEGYQPELTKLGTVEWNIVKKRLKKNLENVAKELLHIYAKKAIEKGIEFGPDTRLQEEFEAQSPFDLTEDQLRTLNEVKDDMESIRPMDRLIIGDVGFGKTEIALRASVKAVLAGKQVVVLAPTTILAAQLYKVFSTRLSNMPIKVSRVTRLDGVKNNKKVLEQAKHGAVDILIGTHRLLSKDVDIPNLGLLIIDEEQRFGVRQKEKIRALRSNIDVLSMSATPIPRTLQMALTGIKDISVISTPPKGRLPVITEVIFDEEILDKVMNEIKRKGQVFIVHNEISTMDSFLLKISNILPSSVKIVSAHGQMKASILEKIVSDFIDKKYDVLIATTIIENGIDMPNVNTIIINEAHQFGLAQLYQLRGRVGRSNIQAYCYLVVPKTKDFIQLHKNSKIYIEEFKNRGINWDVVKDQEEKIKEAVSRVKTILEHQELGAGFKIASRDLEIRGAGNLLGAEQSGHINAVGYEMYIRLLEQEINKIREKIENK